MRRVKYYRNLQRFTFKLVLTSIIMSSVCGNIFSGEVLKTGPVNALPDPTANDDVCRILAIGHSFFAGADDLEKLLPRMLTKQKKWKIKLDFELLWGEHIYPSILVERGELPASGNEQNKARLEKWDKIKEMLKKNSYDYCFFLIGIGSPSSLLRHDGMGMLGAREIARTIHEVSPKTVIIGFATWGLPKDTFEEFAKECDMNLDAWSQAAGSGVAMNVIKLGKENNEGPAPGYAYLKKRWEEGRIDRFFAAPVALAWRNAYAEKGYGQTFLLHRSLKKRDPHGNLWGDYLKTCVYFTMITGEQFDGHGFSEKLGSPGHANADQDENKTSIPDDVARYLERIAFSTVADYSEISKGSISKEKIQKGNKTKAADPEKLIIKRTFDSKGRITKEQRFRNELEKTLIYRTFYDENDAVIRSEELSADGKSVIKYSVFKPEYKDGRLEQRRYLNEKGEYIGRDRYTYYSDGLKKSECFEDAGGQADASYTYKYLAGKVTEEVFLSATGDTAGKRIFKYDPQGRLITILEQDGEGDLFASEEYEYKDTEFKEKPTSIKRMQHNDAAVMLTRLSYDKKGNEKETRMFAMNPETGAEKILSITVYQNIY